MADAAPIVLPVSLFKANTIDGETVADTLLFDSVGQTWYFLSAHFLVSSVTGLVSAPTVSIGTNSSTYNNILPATALTGLTGSTLYLNVPIVTAAVYSPASAGTAVKVRVSTAAVATTYFFNVTLLGIEGLP